MAFIGNTEETETGIFGPEVSYKTSLPCPRVYDKMRLGTAVYIRKPVDERNDRRDINPEDFINAG